MSTETLPETQTAAPLTADELRLIDAYWRAANYLSVGQIYLLGNPLLREPLGKEQIKPRLLGHFGTTPGLNLVYAHMNRAIRRRDLSAIYIAGPGHGGPGLVANAYLEGTYSEIYPHVSEDEDGLRELFRQFSFPGGIPSHVAPETPGSIHEGGELGYALSHAFGAAFDNPDLLVCCVVGDGEAETGPLATSWHGNKWLNARTDGAVLPILQLNGYKIANPTILARIPERELTALLEGYGWRPLYVEGDDPEAVHQAFAATLDEALDEIAGFQHAAREGGDESRPRWPMIVLRTPKGWTGPHEVDGVQVEGTWRSHQVPMTDVRTNGGHLKVLEKWMRSYRPEELFDEQGRLIQELRDLPPRGERRMSANPVANGGEVLRDLVLPDFRSYAVEVEKPATTSSEATRVLGAFLRDVVKRNPGNFRIVGPDETASNRLDAVYEATDKAWMAEILPVDEHLAHEGRVLEILSEHTCQGWLEGYLLTGRHGLFNCYEAFIHLVDSMFNQHAKWLKVTRHIPWRRPIASLNYLLTSHVWRQDHNGFSHQDPGFIDHVINKKAEVVRVYLPPDANCLLSVADHCLRSKSYVNVIVAGKQPALDYLSMEDAIVHCTRGIGIWDWASNDEGGQPDVVMGCAGDIPTLETLAAVALLRRHLPELKVRVVNVVDLMRLRTASPTPRSTRSSRPIGR
jgi:xylulose-5-phosphate/fructose-6-phosphate phosphoketolase